MTMDGTLIVALECLAVLGMAIEGTTVVALGMQDSVVHFCNGSRTLSDEGTVGFVFVMTLEGTAIAAL